VPSAIAKPLVPPYSLYTLVGPTYASWPTHSCGNTAIQDRCWPNFWANVASFSLSPPPRLPVPDPPCARQPWDEPVRLCKAA
jgi:hypothetical protein